MPNRPDPGRPELRPPYTGRSAARRPEPRRGIPPPYRQKRASLPLGAHLRRLFDLRYRSVLRGTAAVLFSALWSFHLSQFPHNALNLWLVLPLLIATAGTADTAHCMQKQWNWYHGGVVLCLYTDLMVLCMIAFFLLYPLTL